MIESNLATPAVDALIWKVYARRNGVDVVVGVKPTREAAEAYRDEFIDKYKSPNGTYWDKDNEGHVITSVLPQSVSRVAAESILGPLPRATTGSP
jgi:hypothetical protein